MKSYPSSAPSPSPTECRDEPNWFYDEINGKQLGCAVFDGNPEEMCERFGEIEHNHKTAYLACCVCGGGDHQSVHPSSIPSLEPSRKPSTQPSISIEPSLLPSGLPTNFPSLVPSHEPSSNPTESIEPSGVPSDQKFSLLPGDPCHYDAECQGVSFFFTQEEIDNGKRRRSNRNRQLFKLPRTKLRKKSTKSEPPSSQPSSSPTSEPTLEPSSQPSSTPSDEPSRTPSDEVSTYDLSKDFASSLYVCNCD